MKLVQLSAWSRCLRAEAVLALVVLPCCSSVAGEGVEAKVGAPDFELPRVQRVTVLTWDRGAVVRPAWSPDGRWLAAGRAGMAGIEIINQEGTETKTLTLDPGSGYKFAWSPDGLEVAYRATVSGGIEPTYIIKSVEVATGRIVELSKPAAQVSPPLWGRSNAWQRVCFRVGTNCMSAPWVSLRGKATPAPARNGNTFLYTDRGQVWSCGPSNTCSQLTEAGGMDPVWSPDRSQIVYSQMGTLMVMAPDGSRKRALGRGHHPSWSPDGRMLVYDVSTDDGHRILSSDLQVIKADGSGATRLTNTPEVLECEPAWSPDGKCIACRTEDSGRVMLLWLE